MCDLPARCDADVVPRVAPAGFEFHTGAKTGVLTARTNATNAHVLTNRPANDASRQRPFDPR